MSSTKTNPGRTNQKLYFAKLQLDLLVQALAAGGFEAEPQGLACREAVVFHLEGAYLSFLQELCRFYKLPLDLNSSEAIRLAMDAKGQISPEVTQLQQWEGDSASWLAGLHAGYRAIFEATEAVKAEPEADGEELETSASGNHLMKEIRVVSTSADLPLSEPDIARLKDWHQSLTQAIREFRREMAEW